SDSSSTALRFSVHGGLVALIITPRGMSMISALDGTLIVTPSLGTDSTAGAAGGAFAGELDSDAFSLQSSARRAAQKQTFCMIAFLPFYRLFFLSHCSSSAADAASRMHLSCLTQTARPNSGALENRWTHSFCSASGMVTPFSCW